MPRDAHVGRDPSPRRAVWRLRMDGVLGLLAPMRCCGCSARLAPCNDASAARGTHASARLLPERFCPRCETALGLEPPGAVARRVRHVAWPVYAPLRYAGAGEAWVRRIKYPRAGLGGLDAEARGLVDALARILARELPPVDVVVPVPLHPSALLRRETNAAWLWARALSRATGAPLLSRALRKRRITCPQKGLGLAERRANVHDAFFVAPRCTPELLRAEHVLLADDVVTTGATLEACMVALRDAGVPGVPGVGVAACIARTPSNREG